MEKLPLLITANDGHVRIVCVADNCPAQWKVVRTGHITNGVNLEAAIFHAYDEHADLIK